MTKAKFITTTTLSVILGATLMVGISRAVDAYPQCGGKSFTMTEWRGHGHHGRGDMMGGGMMEGMGPMGHLCGPNRAERLDKAIAFVNNFIKLTPEQTTAWNTLAEALRSGAGKVGTACDQMREAGRPATLPDKLARMEAMMTTGLEVLREVRPAFDAFYATLDEAQKQQLDDMLDHHGPGHGPRDGQGPRNGQPPQ